MKIKEITYQNRRDFTAIYECQYCRHEAEGGGYDDAFFHKNVIPSMACDKCGRTAEGADEEYRPLTTKYSEGYQI